MSNERGSSAGCFSAVARLLLCKGHLQTHPSSDHSPHHMVNLPLSLKKDHHFSCPEEVTPTPPAAAPGLVARLMGLESLPPNLTPARPRASSADSVTRSRSVNFMDYYLLHHDFPSSTPNARHRRARTSVSFREVAPVLAQNHPDFILLYLDDKENGSSKLEKPNQRTVPSREIKGSDQVGSTSKCKSIVVEQSKQKREAIRIKKKDKENVGISKLKEKEQRTRRRTKQSLRESYVQNDRALECSAVNQPRKKVHSHRRKCQVKMENQREVVVESKFMKKIKNRKAVTDGIGSLSQSSAPPLSGKKRAVNSACSKKSCETKPKAAVELEPKQQPAENGEETARCAAKLAEEDIMSGVWINKGSEVVEYEGLEDLCVEFGQQLLDLLVEELLLG